MLTSVLLGRLQQEDFDEDVDLDMLTQGTFPSGVKLILAPIILPVTMALDQNIVYASMPLPHSPEAIPPTLKLSIKPATTGLDITWTLDPASGTMVERIQGAVDRAGQLGMDAVKAVAEVERALRET